MSNQCVYRLSTPVKRSGLRVAHSVSLPKKTCKFDNQHVIFVNLGIWLGPVAGSDSLLSLFQFFKLDIADVTNFPGCLPFAKPWPTGLSWMFEQTIIFGLALCYGTSGCCTKLRGNIANCPKPGSTVLSWMFKQTNTVGACARLWC